MEITWSDLDGQVERERERKNYVDGQIEKLDRWTVRKIDSEMI